MEAPMMSMGMSSPELMQEPAAIAAKLLYA
jgi:hypothetical protein